MKMAHSMQGIYSPLPQSISDSDSEKEISMEPLCTKYEPKNKFENVYRQNGHGVQLEDDVIKIKRGASKMSTARKIAFVSSIILCFLPIIIFLWVLPCTELHTCPVKILNWKYQQSEIELKGPIYLVNGVYKSNYNLAVMYKGSFNSPKALKNGVISFMGLTGSVAWDFQQEVEPLKIDCGSIDTNGDGNLDCLLLDKKGLKAIETISGQALWHAHSAEEKALISNLDMPVVITDLNKDGIAELLCIFDKTSMLVLSGKTGRALANIQVRHCEQIKDLCKIDGSPEIFSYYCIANSSMDLHHASLSEIEKSFANPQYVMKVTIINEYQETDIYTAGNRRLRINNSIYCTECKSFMSLMGMDSNEVLKSWSFPNAFIMNPKPFSFKPSETKRAQLKGHLNGFIVKIWQWSEHYRRLRPVNKRSVQPTNSSEAFFSTEVSERVVLITFNETDVQVINASFTEINQVCRMEETNCQPDVENQRDSLLVADIEHDSSTELVSFYSSYTKRGGDWHLTSYVKVLRLEEELPKLYAAK
ncbi:uncharacterized protein LOC143203819 [Rhynchophorus ferrugineus]|uniref:uncharacterized protein LOC143203819 n=1 Tax=Rhynchophorus ferrugineus TaxID=354439 RepID=UPI003FCE348B